MLGIVTMLDHDIGGIGQLKVFSLACLYIEATKMKENAYLDTGHSLNIQQTQPQAISRPLTLVSAR